MRPHHIRLGKLDLLFRISHLLNLRAGGHAVINFVTFGKPMTLWRLKVGVLLPRW